MTKTTERAIRREKFAKRVGQNLRRVRRAAGLSQDTLAYVAEVHRTEVSQIERGTRLPGAYTLWKFAQCLDAEPGELLAGLTWHAPGSGSGRLEVTED